MINVLNRNFRSTRSCPIDVVTVVGKRSSSFGVRSAKREGTCLSIVKPEVFTLGSFHSCE